MYDLKVIFINHLLKFRLELLALKARDKYIIIKTKSGDRCIKAFNG